jgi:drug/metabolite transporter (DMT)-like permease
MSDRRLHSLGVVCGFAAGAWLGAAEAPTKLVNTGFSPFLISLGMVAGVFVARWTLPMALKGIGFVLMDLREKPHLIVWAVLAGALWAVANTLTVFAIRDVGLTVAFPLWNTNSLIGLLWGWLLFGELRGAGRKQTARVLGGAAAIALGAGLLAFATASAPAITERAAATGIAAALGAGLLWGTMYIPYRKAYISGLNPLSFVTIFTFGELGAVLLLAIAFEGGGRRLANEIAHVRPGLFWLFLGGFCWVIGDLFQQYAAKYIGIGRGIPLSNTNQLWGLAWGALVFGETSGRRILPIAAGSLIMAAGAWAISSAEAPEGEKDAWSKAAEHERVRYGFDPGRLGTSGDGTRRSWWEVAVVTIAAGIFVWLASNVRRQPIAINAIWTSVIIAASTGLLVVAAVMLWRRTRFN